MSGRPLVVHVVGARPNYMKVAPVYKALADHALVDQRLVHTGQHYDPLLRDVFFDQLPLPRPDLQLAVGSGPHGEQTGRALIELEQAFVRIEPDLVLVPGDVNSTLAGALAAVKLGIPVCHLEAGLRSFDDTMPEEHNRKLTDHVSTLLLTHSAEADRNLVAEGVALERIRLVGNTMVDSLSSALAAARDLAEWTRLGLPEAGYVLVTLHRPDLVDDPGRLADALVALERLASDLPVVFPVHPRTRAQIGDRRFANVLITDPLPYLSFVSLESAAAAVVTDSGGVQEETTALGVPCFTLRETTERPVTVTTGTNVVIGMDFERLAALGSEIVLGLPRSSRRPPLWDGRAGPRAATAIEATLAIESALSGVR